MASTNIKMESGQYIGTRVGTRVGNKINQISDNLKTFWKNGGKDGICAGAVVGGSALALLGMGYICGLKRKKKHQ